MNRSDFLLMMRTEGAKGAFERLIEQKLEMPNLSGITLNNNNFTGADLSRREFRSVTFRSCTFRENVLTETTFKDCTFEDCTWHSQMAGATFSHCRFGRGTLREDGGFKDATLNGCTGTHTIYNNRKGAGDSFWRVRRVNPAPAQPAATN